jgi:O-antigen/teichoic acid export membrane protein
MFKGNIIAQIISVIGALIIAKLYGAGTYGIYAVYLSISGILTIPNTLQMEYAIVMSNNKDEGSKIMSSLLIIPFIISIIYLVFIFFGKNEISTSLDVLILSVLAAILLAQNKVFDSFLTLKKKFKSLSSVRIVTSISTILFQLILFYYFNKKGLILGSMLGIITTSIYYYKLNWKSISRVNYIHFKESIIKYKNLVRYALPSNLINAIAGNIMPILLLMYFSSQETGSYALSLKILVTPLFLISSTINQVYFEKASKLFSLSKDKLFLFTKRIVLNNFAIMFIILLLINIVGIKILVYFFSNNWEHLELFTLILSFLVLARSIYSPISSIVEVIDKNQVNLIFNCYLLFVNLIAIYIGYSYKNIIHAVSILSLFGGLGYLSIFAYLMNELNNYKNLKD